MSELKFIPCPCCGSNRIIHFKTTKNRGYATCIDCGMRTRGCGNYENKDDLKWRERATILWNTRTPMANIVENIVTSLESEKTVFLGTRTEQTDTILIDDAIKIVKQEINNGLE